MLVLLADAELSRVRAMQAGGTMPKQDDNALKNLEARLNSDEALQAAFLKNPSAVMKREGIVLSPEMEKAVKAQVSDLALSKLATLARKPKIGIKITITIKF
jgi:hypothetical protein